MHFVYLHCSGSAFPDCIEGPESPTPVIQENVISLCFSLSKMWAYHQLNAFNLTYLPTMMVNDEKCIHLPRITLPIASISHS